MNIIFQSAESERSYFSETFFDKNGTEQLVDIPSKDDFKDFMKSVLTKYSSFSTLSGYYKQKSGVSMGGKLSAQLANIFCHMMESTIIENHLKTKIIHSTPDM